MALSVKREALGQTLGLPLASAAEAGLAWADAHQPPLRAARHLPGCPGRPPARNRLDPASGSATRLPAKRSQPEPSRGPSQDVSPNAGSPADAALPPLAGVAAGARLLLRAHGLPGCRMAGVARRHRRHASTVALCLSDIRARLWAKRGPDRLRGRAAMLCCCQVRQAAASRCWRTACRGCCPGCRTMKRWSQRRCSACLGALRPPGGGSAASGPLTTPRLPRHSPGGGHRPAPARSPSRIRACCSRTSCPSFPARPLGSPERAPGDRLRHHFPRSPPDRVPPPASSWSPR